jgi:LysR family transcriptional regulator, transcriptional activator for bauABCD operon
VASATGGLSGRLRIGISDGTFTSEELGVQRVIQAFLQPGMDVFIDLSLGTPAELERQIADGERDIVIGPFSQKAPGVIYRSFASEPHLLYCGADHPLFSKEDGAIDQKDIEEARFSVRSYRHFDDLYLVGHPRAGASVVHMEAQLMLILSGHFIGFLPCHFAEPHMAEGRLRAIKPKSFGFSSVHKIACRKADRSRVLVKAFLDTVRSANTAG